MSDVVQQPRREETPLAARHPFRIAAAAGFGPLSERAKRVWHGESAPCASCGMLNMRSTKTCAHCNQDLTQEMLEKMAKHSGPWFVYDSVRPFPGVSLERMLLQIKRGVLNHTSIVRGPTTYYQWRFAGEAPILSKFLGLCWNCQGSVAQEERYCPSCKAVLDGFHRAQQLDVSGPPEVAAELEKLGKAVDDAVPPDGSAATVRSNDRPLGKAIIVFFIVATAVVLGLVALVTFLKTGQSG
jgi:hypothetical protein